MEFIKKKFIDALVYMFVDLTCSGTSDTVPEPSGVLQATRKRATAPVASYYHPDNSNSSEFNPLSGVTFRDNPNSDVAVVGRGYAADEDANPLLSIHRSSPAMMQTKKNKDRRRFSRGLWLLIQSFSSVL